MILEDEDLHPWERNWDYSSFEIEATNFYQGFYETRVLINGNVIFYQQGNDNFNIVRIEKAIINGEEKSYVTINFNGKAFGWYDPSGEFQEVYEIINGIFKGVIE